MLLQYKRAFLEVKPGSIGNMWIVFETDKWAKIRTALVFRYLFPRNKKYRFHILKYHEIRGSFMWGNGANCHVYTLRHLLQLLTMMNFYNTVTKS